MHALSYGDKILSIPFPMISQTTRILTYREIHNLKAGLLEEIETGTRYRFCYESGYSGPTVSLTMSVQEEPHEYDVFPPFFEGLLPEGFNLEALLRQNKIDRNDLFSQLMAVGEEMVGAVTVKEVE